MHHLIYPYYQYGRKSIFFRTMINTNGATLIDLRLRHNERDGILNHQRLYLPQAQIKENIKATRYWPLWEESTGNRWSPVTKDQLRGKCFNFMTSSRADKNGHGETLLNAFFSPWWILWVCAVHISSWWCTCRHNDYCHLCQKHCVVCICYSIRDMF